MSQIVFDDDNLIFESAPDAMVVESDEEIVTIEIESENIVIDDDKNEVIVVLAEGPQGPPGQDGSGDKHFVYNQVSPATVWTINHTLQKYPSVSVIDSGGNVVIGDIQYISISQLTITFSAQFAGVAYLN